MREPALIEHGQAQTGPTFADPVFILCHARSGSTLLRFILDEHPDLACPPETNLPALCAQLATVWSLIEGAPLAENRGDEPPEIPDAAIAGIRGTLDRMLGSYLVRRGKQRYCDKSLGTARFAELLLRVYPEAKFICLFRHPMDVIASGLEACPWGLNGYGFDAYATTTPGNSVMALARFWVDNTAMTLAAEELFAAQSLRVRYEDLANEPEQTAAEILKFLDVQPAAGIAKSCFSVERERFGPGDHKIWYTSEISPDSIGRGWSVPPALIADQLLASMNEFAGRLGYLPVSEQWGACAPPADFRVRAEQAAAGPAPVAGSAPVHSALLGSRLSAGLVGTDQATAERWTPHGHEAIVAISVPADRRQPAEHWLVDLGARTVSFTSSAAQQRSDWDVIGSAQAWEDIIAGTLNLSAALRSGQIRYFGNDEDASSVAGDSRIRILADLLEVARW